jgi:hypothetical protein
MDKIILFVRHTMENPMTLGILAILLIVVPITGIWAIHKYGWEHWEPFQKRHK